MALGDTLFRGVTDWLRLVGNTTTTRKFLQQTGTGSASAAPVWDGLGVLDSIELTDGITAPSAVPGRAVLYVDSADGSLKVKFGDGTVAVLAVNTLSDTVFNVPAGAVSLSGTTPVLSVGGSPSVAIPLGAISLTGQTPTLTVLDNNHTLAVPVGAVSLTGQTPTLNVRGAEFSIYKPSDTSRSATTVLAADPDLVIPVNANEAIFVTIRLRIQGLSTTGDFKFGWNVPSGTTLFFDRYQQSTLRDGFIAPSTGVTPTGLSIETDVTTLGGANAIYGFEIRGWILVSSTAGTVELTWAQNVSNANATTIMAGSFVRGEIVNQ